MTKAKWLLVECGTNDTAIAQLKVSLDKYGYEYKEDKDTPNPLQKITSYPEDECVVPQCGLRFANKIKDKKWFPGVWLNEIMYRCTSYYPVLDEYLLNRKNEITTVQNFKNNKAYYFDKFSKNDSIFIRPNTGLKSFTGSLFPIEKFDFEFKWCIVEDFTFDDTKIIVSTPQKIMNEWRFIVAEGEVITWSQYKKSIDGVLTFYQSSNFCPDTALSLAKTIAPKYNPDPVWSIDICQTNDGNFHLLEIGSFTCAGLYKCDTDIIVQKVSGIAEREFNNRKTL